MFNLVSWEKECEEQRIKDLEWEQWTVPMSRIEESIPAEPDPESEYQPPIRWHLPPETMDEVILYHDRVVKQAKKLLATVSPDEVRDITLALRLHDQEMFEYFGDERLSAGKELQEWIYLALHPEKLGTIKHVAPNFKIREQPMTQTRMIAEGILQKVVVDGIVHFVRKEVDGKLQTSKV